MFHHVRTSTFVSAVLLSVALPALSQVTVTDALQYSSINSSTRMFRMFYRTGTPVTSTMPIIVYFHGGGWFKGGYADSTITPAKCNSDQTIACWLADNGYVVFAINYTLVNIYASASDLTVTGTNTVTSASHSFQPSDVGMRLLLVTTSGGWHPDGYNIVSVSGGAATLSGSPGAVGLTAGQYRLLGTSTLWPAQWQDCNCFLRFLAEQAGVSVPGNPNNIVLMGASSGGHLAAVTGLSGNNAFSTNCDHVSTNYTVQGIVGFSPPTDLVSLVTTMVDNSKNNVRNLVGCMPGYGNCNPVATSASVTNYVAENLPPYMSFSGASDTTIPPANVQEAQTAFAALNPPVTQQWIEFGPSFGHPLDLYLYSPCSADNEPSPCGSAGSAFQTALPFIQSVTAGH